MLGGNMKYLKLLCIVGLVAVFFIGLNNSAQKGQQPTFKGMSANPWHYNFKQGALIYSPPDSFFDGQFFNCIPSFWDHTKGYVVLCNDGLYSHSGGQKGACSENDGVEEILYQH
jgi:hypothetical protein